MKPKSEVRLILYFTLAYLVFFSLLAFFERNYEFVYYIAVMLALIYLVLRLYEEIHLPYQILVGLSLLGMLHIMGGVVRIGAVKLYDFYFIPGVLRYDAIVHSSSIFLVTLIIYSIISPHLRDKSRENAIILAFILISAAMGIGALNEIIELVAVLFLRSQNGVGDYLNNAFDLMFNLVGASLAALYLLRYRRRSGSVDNQNDKNS